jgi:succinyl-diaminopimelate desuccinylase
VSLVEDLVWLVDIPSVTGDERSLRDAIAARLSSKVATEVVGESLIAGHQTGKPRIDLYGHLDTVPANGNLPARVEGDRVHGLGTTDMKSGLALMLAALESPAVAAGPYDVVAVFYDREEGPSAENGLESVLDAAGHLGGAELAVVMEPTDNELQLGCQGTINATVTFNGLAAHSARPWLGENAVTKAGEWLAAMHDRQARDVDVAGLVFKETFVSPSTSTTDIRRIDRRSPLNESWPRFAPLPTDSRWSIGPRRPRSRPTTVTLSDSRPAVSPRSPPRRRGPTSPGSPSAALRR